MSFEKRVFIGWFVGLAFIGLVLATPASAQDWKGQGRLAGEVKDADGKPLEDVLVRLELPGRGGPEEPLKTDKKGRWAILGIAGGRWNVDIGKEGYITKNFFADVMQGRHLPMMKTTLEKAAPAGPPPEVVEAIEKGDKAYEEGRYAEARVEYERLLELRPDLGATLLMQIAHCYKQEGNSDKELEFLQRVLDEDPSNTDVRTLMAMEALEVGLVDRGVELLAGIDESAMTNPDILYNIGVAFLNKSRPDDAIAYFTRAVGAQSDYVDGYFQRALTYFGQSRYEECRADFEKVLELSPEGAQAETARKVLSQLPDQE